MPPTITTRIQAEPGEIFAPGSFDSSIGKIIPLTARLGGPDALDLGLGTVKTATIAADGRSVELVIEITVSYAEPPPSDLVIRGRMSFEPEPQLRAGGPLLPAADYAYLSSPHVIYCHACRRAWVENPVLTTIPDNNPPDRSTCVCDPPFPVRWEIDPAPDSIPPEAWKTK